MTDDIELSGEDDTTDEPVPQSDPGPGVPIDPIETDPHQTDDGFRGDPDAPQPKNAAVPED